MESKFKKGDKVRVITDNETSPCGTIGILIIDSYGSLWGGNCDVLLEDGDPKVWLADKCELVKSKKAKLSKQLSDMKHKEFKVGDKVKMVKTGPIGWEESEWTELAYEEVEKKSDDVVEIIVIGKDISEEPYVQLVQGGYRLHPNHFVLVNDK